MSRSGLTVPALVALALAGAPACTSSARKEAQPLVAAVDAYRKADGLAKAAAADAIDAVPCADADVCDAKKSCAATARPTARGLGLKAEVETALDDLHAGRTTQEQAAARGLAGKLDEASRLLEEGRSHVAPCDAKITALRLKYRL